MPETAIGQWFCGGGGTRLQRNESLNLAPKLSSRSLGGMLRHWASI
jgi:hypothetical protein